MTSCDTIIRSFLIFRCVLSNSRIDDVYAMGATAGAIGFSWLRRYTIHMTDRSILTRLPLVTTLQRCLILVTGHHDTPFDDHVVTRPVYTKYRACYMLSVAISQSILIIIIINIILHVCIAPRTNFSIKTNIMYFITHYKWRIIGII